MSRRKSSISKASSYEEIGEFCDTHDLADYWDQLEPVEFEIDIQSEVIYYAIDRELSVKIQYVAKRRGISADTLINLWLQEELQEDQVKPVESEFSSLLHKKYYAVDNELSDRIRVFAKQWDVSANALVNLWLQRKIDQLETIMIESSIKLPSRQYPVDRELSEKISTIAKKRGISANTLVNLWLKEKLQEQKIESKVLVS